MIPSGCTCTNYFAFPFKESNVEVLYITYKQANHIVFEKELADITFSEGEISVQLKQEDTILLQDKVRIKAQIRGRLTDGTAIKSNIVEASSDELLKEGVI